MLAALLMLTQSMLIEIPPEVAASAAAGEHAAAAEQAARDAAARAPEPCARYSRCAIDAHARAIEEVMKAPLPPSASDVLYAQLAHFRGRPSRYAFGRLGYPDRKMLIEGATIYSWVNETSNLDGSPLRCTVKVVVRSARIAGTDFFGNEGACARFAGALDPTFRGRY